MDNIKLSVTLKSVENFHINNSEDYSYYLLVFLLRW